MSSLLSKTVDKFSKGRRGGTIESSSPVLLFDNKTSTDSYPINGLLTIADVAEILKVSVSSVRRLQEQRRIAFIKVGGSVRFARDDIVSFLAGHRVESIGRI